MRLLPLLLLGQACFSPPTLLITLQKRGKKATY